MARKVPRRDDLEDTVAIVVGTRPGIIKMSPLIEEAERRGYDHFVIHAGQHYSYELDEAFFDDLGLEPPAYRLDEVEETQFHGEQTAAMLAGIEAALLEEQPRAVLVCGDANFNLAGALAARKLGMVVGHVEAGLRSNDWQMPEEHNRVMIDHISDYLFSPTEEAAANAREDNVRGEIVVTGNTIVDAVQTHIDIAKTDSTILDDLGIDAGDYFVLTAHREENVDDEAVLSDVLETIAELADEYDRPIVFPIHPRTTKMLEEHGLYERATGIEQLRLIEPLGYLDFLKLLANCSLVLTDSGGIQEEACILQVPCVTLRENTERPETVDVGANVVAGTDPADVLSAVESMCDVETDWSNPIGDGTAAEQVVSTISSTPATWEE